MIINGAGRHRRRQKMRIRDKYPVQFHETDSRQHREKRMHKPCCQELRLSR